MNKTQTVTKFCKGSKSFNCGYFKNVAQFTGDLGDTVSTFTSVGTLPDGYTPENAIVLCLMIEKNGSWRDATGYDAGVYAQFDSDGSIRIYNNSSGSVSSTYTLTIAHL